MPQFDPNVFATQLFWLVVTFTLLYIGITKLVLPRVTDVLEARQRRIDDDLEKAAALKQEAEGVLAEYEKARAEAEAKAQALVREAQDSLAGESARQHDALSPQLAEQVADAEAQIVKAREEAKAGLGAAAAEVVAAAAQHLVGLKVSAEDARSAVEASAGAAGRKGE